MGLSSDQTSNSGNSNEFLPPNSSPTKHTQQNPQESKKLKCPRCESTNTKFCYFNNYNKSQPRHFCKCCRRYWTAGGTLRNVPVGGGRKNKRPKPPTASTKAAATSYEYTNRVTQMDFQAHNPNKGPKQAISTHDDHELHFPSPSFPCSISASGYVSEFGALEESAMAGAEPCLSLSSLDDQPWTYMESIDSNWVWDDIDKFVCSDDVSIPWNDAEIN